MTKHDLNVVEGEELKGRRTRYDGRCAYRPSSIVAPLGLCSFLILWSSQ